jgi:transcriptional regulator GlxA family with amidase domain
MRPRQIAIVVYPAVEALDAVGPHEVFAAALRLVEASRSADRGYRVQLVAQHAAPVRCASGLTLQPEATLAELSGALDTLVVAGGDGSRAAIGNAELIDGIRAVAGRSKRVASVCSGAFLLAEAGLLDGRRATTHWSACAEFAARYPSIQLDPDPIYVRDGSVYTSAGVTAGMDLSLALVEEDLGRDAALTIARYLVLFLRRPANQSQFSAQLSVQTAHRESLRDLQQWIVEHPDAALTIEALAARAAMSPRHFARSFARETGMTPGRYVERVRVEAARRRLEDTSEPIGVIAEACGFGTAETMRRSFIRALASSPAEYRRRFTAAKAA